MAGDDRFEPSVAKNVACTDCAAVVEDHNLARDAHNVTAKAQFMPHQSQFMPDHCQIWQHQCRYAAVNDRIRPKQSRYTPVSCTIVAVLPLPSMIQRRSAAADWVTFVQGAKHSIAIGNHRIHTLASLSITTVRGTLLAVVAVLD